MDPQEYEEDYSFIRMDFFSYFWISSDVTIELALVSANVLWKDAVVLYGVAQFLKTEYTLSSPFSTLGRAVAESS